MQAILSYANVIEADAYHVAMGHNEWSTLDDAAKETALVQATQFIDSVARGKWKGVKTDPAQELAWPRTGSTDEDGLEIGDDVVPALLKNAVCEAALRVSQGEDLMKDTTPAVASESIAGAVSKSYFEGIDNVTNYRKIYALISGFVTTDIGGSQKSGCVRVVRG